jgi:hypothetical protein
MLYPPGRDDHSHIGGYLLRWYSYPSVVQYEFVHPVVQPRATSRPVGLFCQRTAPPSIPLRVDLPRRRGIRQS